jgi:hypothetical protein
MDGWASENIVFQIALGGKERTAEAEDRQRWWKDSFGIHLNWTRKREKRRSSCCMGQNESGRIEEEEK